jgi:hypothetical protein
VSSASNAQPLIQYHYTDGDTRHEHEDLERQVEESLVTERMIASLSTGFSLLATALSVSRDDSGNLYAKRVVLEITRAVRPRLGLHEPRGALGHRKPRVLPKERRRHQWQAAS